MPATILDFNRAQPARRATKPGTVILAMEIDSTGSANPHALSDAMEQSMTMLVLAGGLLFGAGLFRFGLGMGAAGAVMGDALYVSAGLTAATPFVIMGQALGRR